MPTDPTALREVLSSIDFPASKEKLVEHAERHGASEQALRALRAMPPEEYQNVTEVFRAVPMTMSSTEGQTSSDKAQQARHNTASGLAEHQTETPTNPIVDELGENRGS